MRLTLNIDHCVSRKIQCDIKASGHVSCMNMFTEPGQAFKVKRKWQYLVGCCCIVRHVTGTKIKEAGQAV